MSETPEGVAFQLLEILMRNEAQAAELKTRTTAIARSWVLNTYAECLQAATGQRSRGEGPGQMGGGGGGKGGVRVGGRPGLGKGGGGRGSPSLED